MIKIYIIVSSVLLPFLASASVPPNGAELEDKCFALLKPHIEGAKVVGISWNRYGNIISFRLSKNVGSKLTSSATCSVRDNSDVIRTFESKEEGSARYAVEQNAKQEEEKKLSRFK